ncbi:MAG: phosphoenolpyruvate-utilizing N-terminal domain-containing protein, partial [Betaproteobacteria bacterium]
MSFTIHGIGVSGGIAIGHAQLVSHAQLEVAHYDISKSRVMEEQARFDAAVVTARAELASLGEHIPAGTPAEFEAFLNVHLMILDDPTLSETPKHLIESLQCNAEWALKLQMDALIEQFESIEDGYLRDRKTDVIQVVERILKVLMGRPGQVLARSTPEENSILVAHDLSPADVIQYKSHRFASFITDLGGGTSHTAIIARSLNIPSVVALHHARTLIRENEVLIVDGSSGVVIVNPDRTVLAEYKLRQEQWQLERLKLKRLKKT